MCPAFWLCQTKLPETGRATLQCLWIKKHSPFSYFKATPPFIPLATLIRYRRNRGWVWGWVGCVGLMMRLMCWTRKRSSIV